MAHLVLLPLMLGLPGREAPAPAGAAPREGLSLREAARTRRFWLLLLVYAICGLDDFFVTTHVVAMAEDSGLDPLFSGHLLALMGLTGLAGVIAAGFESAQVDMEGRKLVFRRMAKAPEQARGFAEPTQKPYATKDGRHPAFGALKDITHLVPGVDLTEPAFPEWADLLDKKYGPEVK